MVLVEMFFQSYSAIHKVLGATLFLPQILVTVDAVGQVRVVSQSYVYSMASLQMLGDAAIAAQMAATVLTDGHAEVY